MFSNYNMIMIIILSVSYLLFMNYQVNIKESIESFFQVSGSMNQLLLSVLFMFFVRVSFHVYYTYFKNKNNQIVTESLRNYRPNCRTYKHFQQKPQHLFDNYLKR